MGLSRAVSEIKGDFCHRGSMIDARGFTALSARKPPAGQLDIMP